MMRGSLMCPSRGNPFEGGRDPTLLEEKVLTLLEDEDISEKRCDRIMAVLDEHYKEISAKNGAEEAAAEVAWLAAQDGKATQA